MFAASQHRVQRPRARPLHDRRITILLLLSGWVLLTADAARPIAFAPFGIEAIATPGLGLALVFVVSAFIGFEATAIFGEEARDPKRTISRPTSPSP